MNQLTYDTITTGRLTDYHEAADRYRQIHAENAVRRPGWRVRTAGMLRRAADMIDNRRARRPEPQPA